MTVSHYLMQNKGSGVNTAFDQLKNIYCTSYCPPLVCVSRYNGVVGMFSRGLVLVSVCVQPDWCCYRYVLP